MSTRRQTIMQLGAAGVELLLPGSAFSAEKEEGPQFREWTGDSFAPMHAIRDGQWNRQLPEPERTVDVVVVGGGIAGLAVASMLDEFDIVLLEREAEPGGNARSGIWRGIEYALGSAYFVDISGRFGAFYDQLGVTPHPVPEPRDGIFTAPGSPNASVEIFRKPLEALRAHLAAVAAGPDFPKIPIGEATERALALDRISFLDYLKQEHIDPILLGLIDAYCYSSMGAGAGQVSAYAGVNFYSEITGPIYAFPGGNAILARTMAKRCARAGANRLLTGAAVFAVEPAEAGLARVGWFDAFQPGEPRCIAARWVVIAAPLFFAGRILRGVDPEVAAAMKGLAHGSYLVANCCFEGEVKPLAYDNLTPGNPAFSDVVDATAVLPTASRPADRNVLTVYAPFRDPAQGRGLLLAGDREALFDPILASLKRLLPGNFNTAKLAEVRLTRWGHKHLIPRPGLIAQMRAMPKRFGNVLLAHSDGQGMPAIESAIAEALQATDTIKGSVRRSK